MSISGYQSSNSSEKILAVSSVPPGRSRIRKKTKNLSLKLQPSFSTKKNETEETTPPPPSLITWLRNKTPQVKVNMLVERGVPDHEVPTSTEQMHGLRDVSLLFQKSTDAVSSNLDCLLSPNPCSAPAYDEQDPDSSSSHAFKRGFGSSERLIERCGESETEVSLLFKAAIRCKERKPLDGERWVTLNQVVQESRCLKTEPDQDQEVSSSGSVTGSRLPPGDALPQSVGLKLDKYQEILDAWSNKGPFWTGDDDDPSWLQLVPDSLLAQSTMGSVERMTWTVPEMSHDDSSKEHWRKGRQASVLRYKEKRQSRLFSKRIRYKVRRLNAQARPRFKGRFVKRED